MSFKSCKTKATRRLTQMEKAFSLEFHKAVFVAMMCLTSNWALQLRSAAEENEDIAILYSKFLSKLLEAEDNSEGDAGETKDSKVSLSPAAFIPLYRTSSCSKARRGRGVARRKATARGRREASTATTDDGSRRRTTKELRAVFDWFNRHNERLPDDKWFAGLTEQERTYLALLASVYGSPSSLLLQQQQNPRLDHPIKSSTRFGTDKLNGELASALGLGALLRILGWVSSRFAVLSSLLDACLCAGHPDRPRSLPSSPLSDAALRAVVGRASAARQNSLLGTETSHGRRREGIGPETSEERRRREQRGERRSRTGSARLREVEGAGDHSRKTSAESDSGAASGSLQSKKTGPAEPPSGELPSSRVDRSASPRLFFLGEGQWN